MVSSEYQFLHSPRVADGRLSELNGEIMRFKVFLLVLLASSLGRSQTVTSFEGIDASQLAHPGLDVDPNGAVGTKQYMEWVNVAFQAYDKVTAAPVWSAPKTGTAPFHANNMPNCFNVGGDGVITFDHLALRWVIALRSAPTKGNYYYCVAISNTDDLTSNTLSWHTYQFSLNPVLGVNTKGDAYWPDWPKFGTWRDGYYVSFDLNDVDRSYRQIGTVVCALDRTNMLVGGTARPMQCFSDPNPIPTNGSVYLEHSLIPAEVEGTSAPPSGRDEFLVSIQNPPLNGTTTTSNSINVWDFHVDWVNPANSSFNPSTLAVPTYTPGCYDPSRPVSTLCIPEPSTATTNVRVDSVGDRFMPGFGYRNFGTYESFLISHTIRTGVKNKQTGIGWIELRGSGVPTVYQTGVINPNALFRFMPSIAQDSAGNAAAGYNISSAGTHPGIRASWWNLNGPFEPTQVAMTKATADEENSWHWGDYSSMTIDPVDDCTFWYVGQYFLSNQTGSEFNWNTRVGHFKVSTCSGKK